MSLTVDYERSLSVKQLLDGVIQIVILEIISSR